MLKEQLEVFRVSGKQIQSERVVESYLSIRDRLITSWQTSLSDDSDGREALYRQLKGLDAVIDDIITDWSK